MMTRKDTSDSDRAAAWCRRLKFDMGQVYVMITFSILPVIVVYLILSKHIVQGLLWEA